MELEPEFSRLSFDLDLTEFDGQPQGNSSHAVNNPRSFNGPSQARTTSTDLTSANDNPAEFSFGVDPTLFDLSSFFEVDSPSADNSKLDAPEMYCRGVEQNLSPFTLDPRTHVNFNAFEVCAMNASWQHWVDLAFENRHYFQEINGLLDVTQPECAQGQYYPPVSSSQRGCHLLSSAEPQLAFTSQVTSDACDLTGLLNFTDSSEIEKFTNHASNISSSGTSDKIMADCYSGDHGVSGDVPDLCVRPEVLTLPPSYQNSLSTPDDQDTEATANPQELLIRIDIDTCEDPGSQRPVLIFHDLLSNFDINVKPPPSKRKRSSFTKAGKEKVSLVRDWGACTFCRSRKVSCSATEVCEQCIRTVEDPTIAKQICLRTKIQDIYVGVKELHGPSLRAKKERLQPFLTSLDGIPQDVRLSLQAEMDSHRSIAELNVQVMQCTASPNGRWKSLKKARGIYITSNFLKEKRYIIIPSALPRTEDLDTFGRDILLKSADSLSGKMTRVLDEFLSCYCNHREPTRLHQLSNLTLRIASLNNFVAYGFLNLRDGSYDLLKRLDGTEGDSEKFVSETVHDQIRILAAEGLEPAEKEVFSELDRLPKIVGASNHARIIAGICLLRCLLLYRDKLIRDHIRLGLPRPKSYHQPRLEKSAFMYRRLTVAFGTLCREHDCPLTMTWEDEENQEGSNGSEELRLLFSQLRCAFLEFCRENLTSQYDDVFRSLISEPVKNRKTRKRRRIAT